MTTATLEKERAHAKQHTQQGDHLAMLDVIQIDRALVTKGGLRTFSKLAWPTLHPGIPLSWGWAHDAMSDFIQAFIIGTIQDGILNVPPRMSKSTIASVCAPVFSWIEMAYLRWLTSSYRDSLSTRDSVRSRRLIQSAWFQARWGDKFSLAGDQNQKTFYENTKGGYRMAQSVAGGSTGEGGNRIIVDDPHNVRRAESDTERMNALSWWDEEMSSRLDDPKKDGRLIIMQRLHERDLSGHCLAKGTYEHLCLPMEFEVYNPALADSVPPCRVSAIGFADPRKGEGELLEPGRFSHEVVEKLKVGMTPYAYAGQYQQHPTPRKGNMFDVNMIEVVDSIPVGMSVAVRYWDKAGTDASVAKGRGAFTAGVKMGKITKGIHKGKYIWLDVKRGQWSAGKREEIIKNTATQDGRAVKPFVEQEPGSGGKESAENTLANLASVGIKGGKDSPTGDKTLRAEPLSAQVELGNMLMLRGPWNDELIGELRKFPVGAKKDQVDGSSGAYNKLCVMSGGGFIW